MSSSPCRVHSWLLVCCLLVGACTTARQTDGPRPGPPLPSEASRPAGALYAADEALRDVLASPLSHLGTGSWPGSNRMYACAFQNDRVLVVNVYCGITERPAFRLDVYAPTRGHVRIYAETRGPIGASRTQDYFTFMVESDLPWRAGTPSLAASTTFATLRDYEQQRYDAYLPACFFGREHDKVRQGCLGPLAVHEAAWSDRSRLFFAEADADWQRVVHELTDWGRRHGKEPD